MGKHNKHKSANSVLDENLVTTEEEVQSISPDVKPKKHKHKKQADDEVQIEPSTSKKHKKKKISHETPIKQEEMEIKVEPELIIKQEPDEEFVEPPPKPKKKKKRAEHSIVNDENQQFNSNKKIKQDDCGEFTNDGENEKEDEEELNFPAEHLPKLLAQIEKAIPDNDTMSYISRAKKLDWKEVAFYDYSAERCKETWYYIQKRQRHYRLMHELVTEAKDWLKTPWINFNKGTKNRTIIHPDFPKKPLSSYMLFYLERRDKIMETNPGIKMPDMSRIIAQQYNELEEQNKEKYIKLASSRREGYEQEVEDFYAKHPEIQRQEKQLEPRIPKGPKKPPTPFLLFFEEQLKKADNVTDRQAFKDACREKFKNLSEKKKMVWIDWALKMQNKYQEEMKQYQSDHPNFVVKDKKVLTKEEKLLKERMEGKPEKPPNSSYSLFCTIHLKCEEYKSYDAKERMRLIAAKWKSLPQSEKENYKIKTQNLMDQYKQNYAAYLETLPADKRADELKKPKRRMSKAVEELPTPKKVKAKMDEDEDEPVQKNDMTTLNPLKNIVIPDTWEDMKEREKAMYVKYIQKIRNYFDQQHETASKNRETSSDSESDSSSDSE